MMRLYRLRLRRGVPITVHLRTVHKFLWTRIYGVQIGPWFIGAIRGTETK